MCSVNIKIRFFLNMFYTQPYILSNRITNDKVYIEKKICNNTSLQVKEEKQHFERKLYNKHSNL